MGKALSKKELGKYKEDGFFFPIDALNQGETSRFRAALESYENSDGASLHGSARSKSHLLFTWADELIRIPRILDAVEDIIGPDILCWNTLWWIKEPQSNSFVSWHQDTRYWGLDTDDLVTAWIALSPATKESGCMKVLPRSHKGEILPHSDEYNEDNLLTRGQEISAPINESENRYMTLKAGQASLHNVRIAHASGKNSTMDRRIGLSVHYIKPDARQLEIAWDSASLVRGKDRFNHFDLAPRPKKDLDEEAVNYHKKASNAFREILFKGAEKTRSVL